MSFHFLTSAWLLFTYLWIASLERWTCRFDCAGNLLYSTLLFSVEQCHSKIQSCEKAKNFVWTAKLMISSQLFHSIIIYSRVVPRP